MCGINKALYKWRFSGFRLHLGGDAELQRLGVDDDGCEDTLQDYSHKTVDAENQCVALPGQRFGYFKTVNTD